MIYELFLENQLVDIKEDIGVQLNFNVDDINKYGSRDTSFSKTIVLPGTARNNKIFGFINELNIKNEYYSNIDNIGFNFNVAQPTPCELRINGLLVLKGVFRLTGIVKNNEILEYEGNLFGELGGFISKISGKKLQDLDFSEYNHNFTLSNIINSWDNTHGSGYYYPLIDYGGYSTNKINYQPWTFRPALYAKQYIDKMFEEVGYTYESTFLNSSAFKSLIIPQNRKELRTLSSIQLNLVSFTTTASANAKINFATIIKQGDFTTTDNQTFTYGGAVSLKPLVALKIFEGYIITTENKDFYLKFYINIEKPSSNVNRFIRNTTADDFTIPTEILNSRINITSLQWTNIGGSIFKTVVLINGNPFELNTPDYSPKTGTRITLSGLGTGIDGSYSVYSVSYAGGLTTLRLNERATRNVLGVNGNLTWTPRIRKNSTLYFQRATSLPFSAENDISDSIIETGDKITIGTFGYGGTLYIASNFVLSNNVPILTRPVINDLITVNDSIPQNVMQKDFLTWIIQMFNLYIIEDKYEKNKLYIEPYKDFYDYDNPIDWTNKISRDKTWNIKPMGMLNGRFFEYKFKDDNDFYNENHKKKWNKNYGDRLFDSGFQFAKEKQTISIGFSPTVLVEYLGADKIVSVIYKKIKGTSVDQEDRMDSNIRILSAKKITGVNSWKIEDKAAAISSSVLTSYGYAGHFNDPRDPTFDINFGASDEIYFDPNTYTSNNLFNVYWSDYIAEIIDKDSKLLSCYVYLNDLDIHDIDFSKPIFIDGALWRINKIVDYDASNSELTKVELLKIINNG